MGGQALCESRPRGTAFSHVNVLHCTSNSLVPYGLLPQVKRQHFYSYVLAVAELDEVFILFYFYYFF